MDAERLRAEKEALRGAMRARLAAIDAGWRVERSDALAALLAACPLWSRARTLLSFLSLASEVDTLPLHRAALAGGKELGLPRVEGGALLFHRVTNPAAAGKRNRFGVREPDPALPLVEPGPGELVLVLVPGLAFDPTGRRLGRGGGYYDRFLASLPDAVRVGACFDFQLVDRVPEGPGDLRVGWIVTDRRLLRAASPSG